MRVNIGNNFPIKCHLMIYVYHSYSLAIYIYIYTLFPSCTCFGGATFLGVPAETCTCFHISCNIASFPLWSWNLWLWFSSSNNIQYKIQLLKREFLILVSNVNCSNKIFVGLWKTIQSHLNHLLALNFLIISRELLFNVIQLGNTTLDINSTFPNGVWVFMCLNELVGLPLLLNTFLCKQIPNHGSHHQNLASFLRGLHIIKAFSTPWK